MAVAVAGVLLLVVAYLMTNPAKARPFVSGVSADSSRVQSDVEALTGLPGFRCFERPDDLDRAAEWAKSSLEASGLPVEEQGFVVGDLTFRNFFARYGPAGAPLLVVGAHYDVCGYQPGADDNASAVAGLLELARLLQEHRPDVRHRIELALWPLEEPPNYRTPAMGSALARDRAKTCTVDSLTIDARPTSVMTNHWVALASHSSPPPVEGAAVMT